jgi:hypothetical protein
MDRSALAQTGTSCTCADVYALINRLNMAEAARAALLEELPKVEAAERARPGSDLNEANSNGVTNQSILRGAITKGMVSVQMPGAPTSVAQTDARCRSAVTRSSTACMNEILMWHENTVHVPACNDGPKTEIGVRQPQKTVDYVKEEIAGYEAEIARIKEVLRMLPASCRPSGWIGHIQYREQRTTETQRTLPPTSTRISGSERSSTTLIRNVKILYRQAPGAPTTIAAAAVSPRATVEIEERVTKINTVTTRRSCTGGGLATGRPDGSMTSTLEEATTASGQGEKDVEVGFDYDSTTGAYSLSFEIPDAGGTSTQRRNETVSGACNSSDDGTKSSSSQSSIPYSGDRVTVSGSITQRSTTDVLQGIDRIDFTPPVSSPGLSITNSATVRWTFFKLP